MESVLSYKKLQQLTGDGVQHSGEFRILLVDDNVFDAELVLRELKRDTNINFISKTVTSRSTYEQALIEFMPDVVYCDFKISPDFTAITAIRILKKEHPDVPFVLVTGSLAEEVASICVYEGIDDYVLKSNLSRLQLSLYNAIKIRKIELQKKEVYEKLVLSEAQVRNFAKHTNQVLEDERANLAREIHDELGQKLAGIKIGLSSFRMLHQDDKKTVENVTGMMDDVDTAIQTMRKIATSLRPGILDTLGLMASLRWLAYEFEKKNAIKCKLFLKLDEVRMQKNISTCLFRICQEALTNISKHAGATHVVIEAKENGGGLLFRVDDNGNGMETEKLKNPFSMGLLGMRERAKMIGADLEVSSIIGLGTSVQFMKHS